MAKGDKHNDQKDPGFGFKFFNDNDRLVLKNGHFNVARTGLNLLEKTHVYHYLMRLSWQKFLALVLAAFFLINALFALCYFVLGTENLGVVKGLSPLEAYLTCFYFSCQTLTTVGYGHLHPNTHWLSIISSFESLLGFMFFAMVTGLLYGRFARPRIRLRFSKNALISPFKGEKALMFRFANARDEPFVEVECKSFLTYLDSKTGLRRFEKLRLEIENVSMLALNWTLVHVINDKSPLLKMLQGKDFPPFEVVVMVKGFDETYGQHMYKRCSYTHNEIVKNARFLPMVNSENENGSPVLDMDKINSYQRV